MNTLLAACGGFLLAVLWMDLMFDVQAWAYTAASLPQEVVDSIATYYGRVTTRAAPMNRLVGGVMLVTLVGVVLQLWRARFPKWLRGVVGLSAGVPIALAIAWIVPAAVELGSRSAPAAREAALARSILLGHVVCFVSIAVFIGCQLFLSRRAGEVR